MARQGRVGERISAAEHTSRPWRIHEVTPDFEVEDVWALPTPGGPDDFAVLMSSLETGRPEDGASPIGRLLWIARWKLGQWFGWDDERGGLGTRVPSLRDRLPADLREAPRGPESPDSPFTPVYRLDDEFAAELANGTMHGVMHLGWVEDGHGGYRGQMAVLVKPHGRFGRIYMAAIKPFRYLFIYPALMRQWEREWRQRPTTDEALSPVGERVDGGIVTGRPPEWVRAAVPEFEPDYVDLFTLTTPVEETPEGWARTFFGDVPSPPEWLIWRAVLGLELAPGPSPETVAGWRVGAHGSDWIRLDTGSRALTCHLIVGVDDGSVSLATLLRYDRPLRGLQWRPLSALHRALVPRIFAEAEAALRESAGRSGERDHPAAGAAAR